MSEFKGEVSVKSTPVGFDVCFDGETDAHSLGHALSAIILTYLNQVECTHVDCDIDEMVEIIVDGIHCGIENNFETSSQSGERLH